MVDTNMAAGCTRHGILARPTSQLYHTSSVKIRLSNATPRSILARQGCLEASLTAIVATLVCAIALRRGIPINADGWAYWEGAYGLAHGGAYVYLGGAPVEAFPPAYSLLLAGAAAGTNGFSGLSLVCVALVTTFVAAFSWGLFLWRACAGTATSALYGRGPLLVFVAFVLPLWNADVRAEQVTRCIVPLLALALLKPRCGAPVDVVRPPGRWTALVVAGLLTLGVIVKHSFAAWVPAVVVVLFLSRMRRVLVCVVAVVPFCAWWILRSCMDQVGSHAIATLTFTNMHGLVTLLMIVPVVKSVRNAIRGYGPRTVLYGPEESFVGLDRKLLEGAPPLLPPDYPWIQRAPTKAR